MKKYIIALFAVLALTISAQANLVTVTWAPNHSPTAGEFVMTDAGGAPFTAFDTFCVERNQYINVGGTYSYIIANGSDGGINSPNLTPVSIGTAWLYSQFRNGTLVGFKGTAKQQSDLQNAIWYCQGELSSLTGNQWILDAENSLGRTQTGLLANGNGAYGVDVWNLYDCNGGQAQSQLGIQQCATVPEPATWWVSLFILLPFGMAMLKSFRREETV